MPATESEAIGKAPIEDAKKVNITRAAIYSFLSRAFKLEVDERFLESVTAIQPTIMFLSESQGAEELVEGSRLLAEFTKNVSELKGEEKKNMLTDLAAEYAGVFLGFGPKPVHLVESVYLGRDHLLYQEPYHQVLAAYGSLSFEKDKRFPEPEDHVAVEFEFMASLCKWTFQTLEERDVDKAVAYLNLQDEFLKDHIMRWVPDLCDKLKESATSSFYKAVAHLTSGFITLDDGMPRHLTEMLDNAVSVNK